MKIEKLGENKIRITLTTQELQEKDIDFHTFMSNSLETQDLFLNMLEEAEEKIGFHTKDYRVKIEALAMADGDFIITVTRFIPENEKNYTSTLLPKKRVTVSRKKQDIKDTTRATYKFDSFEDYYLFTEYLAQNNFKNRLNIAKNVLVYLYKDNYYLVLENINSEYKNILNFYSAITEFATFVNHSSLFISKLVECGKIVIKNNALRTSLKHFSVN